MARQTVPTRSVEIAPMRAPLSETRIVGAAIELLDRHGQAAFSMRKLGAALGVEAMAIYRYFPSKERLLAAASNNLYEKIGGVTASDDLIDYLRQVMLSFYEVAEHHPSMVELLFIDKDVPAKYARGVADRAILAKAGFGEEAPLVLKALIGYVIGALRQRREGEREARETSFRFGLELLLTGIGIEAIRKQSERS